MEWESRIIHWVTESVTIVKEVVAAKVVSEREIPSKLQYQSKWEFGSRAWSPFNKQNNCFTISELIASRSMGKYCIFEQLCLFVPGSLPSSNTSAPKDWELTYLADRYLHGMYNVQLILEFIIGQGRVIENGEPRAFCLPPFYYFWCVCVNEYVYRIWIKPQFGKKMPNISVPQDPCRFLGNNFPRGGIGTNRADRHNDRHRESWIVVVYYLAIVECLRKRKGRERLVFLLNGCSYTKPNFVCCFIIT